MLHLSKADDLKAFMKVNVTAEDIEERIHDPDFCL